MKKLIMVAMLAALLLSVLAPGIAYAGSACANARADLSPILGRGVDNATGHAIVNYVKGQGVWEINGSIRNLKPNTEYKIQIGIQGTPNPQFDVGYFTTNSKGKADFHYRVTISCPLSNDYEIVRIIDPAGNENPGVGGTIMMMAREDGTTGLLKFRGTMRDSCPPCGGF